MTVIYLDVLLALNLFVDFLLLTASAKVLHLPVSRGRLIAGAFVGAASAALIFLPPLSAPLSLLLKAACAALMVRTAFRWYSLGMFVKQTTVLFLLSALFAGICFAVWLFLAPRGFVVQSGIVYYDVPPLLLALLTLLAYGGVCVYERLTQKRVARGCAYRVLLRGSSGSVTLRALLDTGLHLQEVFSGAPVLIARRRAVEHILPCAVKEALLRPDEPHVVRYVPLSSLGGSTLLPAFRPQSAALCGGGKVQEIGGVWVAVTETLGRGEYDALIGADIAGLLQSERLPTHSDGFGERSCEDP